MSIFFKRLFLFQIFVFISSFIYAGKVLIGEKIIPLAKYWKFEIDPYNLGGQEKWFNRHFNDNGWKTIAVPYNWDLLNEYANYKGIAWYRTTFKISNVSKRNVILSFGEVGMSYKVFVNGRNIASIQCGNYEEQFDISSIVDVGKENSIAIEVDNTLTWGAYWAWGGIRRPIKVLLREPVSVIRQDIKATPNLVDGTATLETIIHLQNTSKSDQFILVDQGIYYHDSLIKRLTNTYLKLQAGESKLVKHQTILPKKDVKLWHFDHPNLYTSKISITQNSKIAYQISDRFGFRKIEIDGLQFKLNGESVRLAGYNWIADDRTTGNTLPAFRYMQDIDLMKSAGANMARISHRPLPSDVMDYLDEKGILVVAEFNNWPPYMNDYNDESKLFASKLIQQNYNHPCIFGWSVGNENGNLKEFPEVNRYVSNIIKYIKNDLDSTRLLTYVSNTADFQDDDAAKYCDIILINKYGNYEKGVDELKKRYLDKAVFMSEYGGHAENLIYDTPNNSFFKSLMTDSIRNKQNLFGYSIWSFNDYRSNYQSPNPATTTPLHQNRQWGIIDVYRNKKRSFKQLQLFYAPVKKMVVELDKKNNHLNVVINPREKLDIPSFSLSGYIIVCESRNEYDKNINFDFAKLNDIKPESPSFRVFFDIDNKGISYYKISLLSPIGYVVLDTIINIMRPPSPSLNSLIKSANAARIIFEKNSFTKEYRVNYEIDGKIKSLPLTIDHYGDITNLPLNKKCNIWVTGVNDFGESLPSENKEFVTSAGYPVLPPVIWQSEPIDHGFSTGYSFHYTDGSYKFRVGDNIADTSNWKITTTGTFGMASVIGLKNGKKYYYQLSRQSGFNASGNCWSEVKEVVPNENHQYDSVILHGFVQKNNQLVVSITPSKNAIGYVVNCKTNHGTSSYFVHSSDISLFRIELSPDTVVHNLSITPKND